MLSLVLAIIHSKNLTRKISSDRCSSKCMPKAVICHLGLNISLLEALVDRAYVCHSLAFQEAGKLSSRTSVGFHSSEDREVAICRREGSLEKCLRCKCLTLGGAELFVELA